MIREYLNKVQQAAPLVHCITNYVTVNDCANILLACGASPIMADEPAEVEEITSICSALLINIGTLNSRTVESMLKAGRRMNELGRPILLDPVGVGASALRTETALTLISELKLAAIRGNVSEIRALVGQTGSSRGVDACPDDFVSESNLDDVKAMAAALAVKTSAIVAVSGAIDVVSDGANTFAIRRGRPEMTQYTGSGCMLSALTTAFIAAEKSAKSCAAAFALMGMAGERAVEKMNRTESGSASMGKFIIDEIYKARSAAAEQVPVFTNGAVNRQRLRESMKLYAVTPCGLKESLTSAVESALKGGATFVQLREKGGETAPVGRFNSSRNSQLATRNSNYDLDNDAFLKEALEVKALCRQFNVPFVINDNVEIAKLADADGVHLGQDDMPVKQARQILGANKIIGVSAHTVEQALQAQRDGADYLGVGAVFNTSTKLDADPMSKETVKAICSAVSIPVVAIGGITRDNLLQLSGCGLSGAAVVSALFSQPDIEQAARELLAQIEITL